MNTPMRRLPVACLMLAISCLCGPVARATESPAGVPFKSEAEHQSMFRAGMVNAKAAFIAGRDEEALHMFEAMIPMAPTAEERRVAEEFAAVVRERIGEYQRRVAPPHVRTLDELSVLYTTAFAYGFGTSAWLALQVKPESFAAAVVPFVLITGASVGGVAIADNYRPFRLGVPQAISAGIYLGALEGVAITGYQHSVATRKKSTVRLGAATMSTILWSGATLGGVIGGTLGALREPTPGQVSLTSSGGLWGGLLAAFAGAAGESRSDYRAEKSFAVGAIGYNVGLIAALLTSPSLAPSVARVRLVDLGGLAGGLVGAGSYLLIADSSANPQASFGISAAGAALGLGLAWWATSDMPEQHYPKPIAAVSRLRPAIVPVKAGAVGVLEWQM